MAEEKDIFDLLREESENLTETPSTQAWQKLEHRLESTRQKSRKRRQSPLNLTVVTVTLMLLLLVGFVSWFVVRDHEKRLRAQKAFDELHFLTGAHWVCQDGKIFDGIFFEEIDSATIGGTRMIGFDSLTVAESRFDIFLQKKAVTATFDHKTFTLQSVDNQTFTFKSSEGSILKIRQSAADKFTLSVDAGTIFSFKKSP